MPKCKARVEVYSRVVGYFRPVQQWNEGKREEFKQRKSFRIEDFLRKRYGRPDEELQQA